MKKIIKISALITAVIVSLTSITIGIVMCNKHINIKEKNSDNDLLYLSSDINYVAIGESKNILFEVTVKKDIDNKTIKIVGDNNFIGELRDDGTNGDKKAKDGIYSAHLELYSDLPKLINYYAKLDEYKSNTIEISFYKQLTYEEYEVVKNDINKNIYDIESKYVSNKDGSINEKAANNIYNNLKTYFLTLKKQGLIKDYTEYQGTFKLKMSGGLDYIHIFDLSNEDRLSNVSRDKKTNTINLSVASLEPFANELKGDAFDKAAKDISEFNNDDFYNLDNEDVDVKFMQHLNNYNTIIINTHGGFDGEETVFTIGEKDNSETTREYIETTGSTDGLYTMSSGNYGISKKFFEKNYANDSFKNTIVYLGSCHGADDSVLVDNNKGLAETLLEKGVDCVFAYKNSVYSGYDNKMCKTIFNSMLKARDNKLTTAREALKIAKDKHGDKDPTYSKWYHYLLSHTIEKALAPKAELILFEKDNDSDYTLLHNMGCVLGQCVDNEDEMCIFATNNVYRNSDDGTRELYCSNADTGISNINLVLPPDKYILEIIPKGSIYESKEIALDVKSNQVINLGNINIDKKVITTTKPVNSTTYVNEEYGWSVELPEEWNKYGFIVDNSVNPMLLTGADTVNFCHKEMYNSYGDGGIFSILACPLEDYHNISDSSFYKKITENAEYVYLYHEFEIQFDTPLSSEKYDILLNEYNILHKAKDSIIESFKLLN